MDSAALPARMAAPARRNSLLSNARLEQVIKAFFGGNAVVAVIVLALITIFLFREGFGFFGQNLNNIQLYRQGGLELVDLIREQADAHTALSRSLNTVREQERRTLAKQGVAPEATMTQLAPFDQFATAFSDASENLNGLVSDSTELAVALRAMLSGFAPETEETAVAAEAAPPSETIPVEAPLSVPAASPAAAATPLTPPPPASAAPDTAAAMAGLRATTATFDTVAAEVTSRVETLMPTAPALTDKNARAGFEKWKSLTRDYLASFPAAVERAKVWDPNQPIPWYRSVSAFIVGRDWVTASFWQDWYGIIPLFVGSLMVSFVALLIAVPLGVSSAIYVSEIASFSEKRFIKPYIEFISAIPSVVLGFFGIAVVGQAIRALSEMPFLSWVPFFPLSERLNVFTAGTLLALMAVPTIFTLAEDALRNVPRGFKEASYALGANRLQTIGRVLVPASLSGIISAILLGLGRVIGETMVVLLCAGNRIEIPNFTEGLGAFFQPVHTMTGIIAQEMGEVVRNSIHYRALFMVGLVLFFITLLINYLAQKFVARYRMSIG